MIKYKTVTNLYQISDKMIDLINKYNIILTISLDGPEYINNKNRVARDGGNVYQRVLHNYKRLNTKGVKIKAIEATYTLSHKEAGITKEKLKESFNWKNRSERNGLSFKPEHVSLKTVHFSPHN